MSRNPIQTVLTAVPQSYDPVIRQWIWKILTETGGLRRLIEKSDTIGHTTKVFLGIARLLDQDMKSFKSSELRCALERACERAHARPAQIPTRTQLAKNMDLLSRTLGLSPVEKSLLLFLVLVEEHPVLHNTIGSLSNRSLATNLELLSKTLKIPKRSCGQILSPKGTLLRSGVLNKPYMGLSGFGEMFSLSKGLSNSLLLPAQSLLDIFSGHFVQSPSPILTLMDFPYLSQDLDILKAYLQQAIQTRRKGVNVLIHGIPGSGKTQCARALAKALDCQLFELATEDHFGEPMPGTARLCAFRLAQGILQGHQRALILFDDVEDVFDSKKEGLTTDHRTQPSSSKAWINRTMEENPVPALWITNHHRFIDPAHLRRFDYALPMAIPPKSVRANIIGAQTIDLNVNEAVHHRLADHPRLAPAILERACQVTRDVCQSGVNRDAGQILERVAGNTMEALGYARECSDRPEAITRYNRELLNANVCLEALTEGLCAQGRGRLCLYGPPGTGKSAFGRYLADLLDRPLLAKRASDLQSMYVGETEKNMARMFREAIQDKAVLLLDEADSFLQDRSNATETWEISQVNEFLTQMEAFPGVFIATTNLMDTLDQASLRRFDVKIRFDHLKQEQAWQMFQDAAACLQLPDGIEAVRPGLKTLTKLTPGDFATVLRQARLLPILTAEALLERLKNECEIKKQGWMRRVGF